MFERYWAHFSDSPVSPTRDRGSASSKELRDQIVASQVEVRSHVGEDAGECPHAERVVVDTVMCARHAA